MIDHKQLLIRTGEALYGSQWQSAIARDLGMSDRHVRRMAAGTAEVKPAIIRDLCRLAAGRISDLGDLVAELNAATSGPPETNS